MQLPILGLNSRQAVSKRFERLKKSGVLIPHILNATMGKSFYRFGEASDLFNFSSVTTLVDTSDNVGLPKSDNVGLHNNNLLYNSIKDKETASPKIVSLREKKIAFMKLIVDWCIANPSKYPKLMLLDFANWWGEAEKKATRIRYDNEKFFEVSKRLRTWFSRMDDKKITDYWAKEKEVGTINELFKKSLNDGSKQGQ